MQYIAVLKNKKDQTKRKIRVKGRGTTGAVKAAGDFCSPGEIVLCVYTDKLVYVYLNPNEAEYE